MKNNTINFILIISILTINACNMKKNKLSEPVAEKIDKVLDGLEYWYDREIFKLYYYKGNTLDSLAKKTGISRNSLFTTIDKVRTKIKEEIE